MCAQRAMRLHIVRGGQEYGPYPVSDVQRFLADGSVFPHDEARKEGDPPGMRAPLAQVLQDAGIGYRATRKGNPFRLALEDLKSLELKLILPWREIASARWFKDRRLLYLAGIGLVPAFALALTRDVTAGYWAVALYFSGLWALFFYYLFKTKQVQLKYCFLCFFFTGMVSITALLLLQRIPPWSGLYALAQSDFLPSRFLGMFLGVGIHEELCKAAILFWLVRRPNKNLIPQTVVFYAMISGLGFGIYEGVAYQQTVNREQGVDMAYLLNIARLTSLPFLHAIWTGLAGYFISFAALYPRRRYGLWALAIAVPAVFHATYNTFGWGLMGLGSALLSVVLLMTYLSTCVQMQRNLIGP